MVEHVLLATDFSAGAEAAGAWARALAEGHGARVTLLHVGPEGEPCDDARRRLEAAAHAFAGASCIVRAGRARDVIPRAADELGADLIVIGRHRGHRGVRQLLGGTAEHVVREASVPVLTVPPTERASAPSFETILVGADFSPASARATEAAVGLLPSGADAARLILLHVWCPPVAGDVECTPPIITTPLAFAEESVRQELERVAAPWRARGVEVAITPREGYPATAIADEAEAAGADLIVLGTHGRKGLVHLVLGSIAERVLHHAECAVLTVRGEG